ncbi:Uncharacterised protein [uncultured archaeon]|nr:Uncharacterised protein [uncultured archaeon]
MPALSSSMQMVCIARLPAGVCTEPPKPTTAVRWKPDVLLPSITFLRIMCSWSTGCEANSLQKINTAPRASGLIACGGSSSASTRQTESNGALYLNALSRSASILTAESSSPSSERTAWSLLLKGIFFCPSSSEGEQAQNSFFPAILWCISIPQIIEPRAANQ